MLNSVQEAGRQDQSLAGSGHGIMIRLKFGNHYSGNELYAV